MNRIKQFDEMLKKYKVQDELPGHVQKEMLKAKKKVFINILKKKGHYSLFIFLVLSLYYYLRMFGLGLSMTKSAVVLAAISLSSTVIVSTGGYLIINKIISGPPVEQKKQIEKKVDGPGQVNTQKDAVLQPENDATIKNNKQVTQTEKNRIKSITPQKEISPKSGYLVDVVDFEFDDEARSNYKHITKHIVSAVRRYKGKYSANLVNRKNNFKSPKILLGSVNSMDNRYVVSVKLINPKTTEVILLTREEFSSNKEMLKACDSIARKIASQL